jgi:hypothetical protein
MASVADAGTVGQSVMANEKPLAGGPVVAGALVAEKTSFRLRASHGFEMA